MIIAVLLIAGLGLLFLWNYIIENTRSDVIAIVSIVLIAIGIVALLAGAGCGIDAIVKNVTADGCLIEYQQRYDSIIYQAENQLYDNDNDVGKKELCDQIQEWNEDIATGKWKSHNFWIGIMNPAKIYDNLELIPIELVK